MTADPRKVEFLAALREYRDREDDAEVGRARLIAACGGLWNCTDMASVMVVAMTANVLSELPQRRTFSTLARALRRQLISEEAGDEFRPYGQRRVLSRGD